MVDFGRKKHSRPSRRVAELSAEVDAAVEDMERLLARLNGSKSAISAMRPTIPTPTKRKKQAAKPGMSFGEYSRLDAGGKRDRIRKGMSLQEDRIRSILSRMRQSEEVGELCYSRSI